MTFWHALAPIAALVAFAGCEGGEGADSGLYEAQLVGDWSGSATTSYGNFPITARLEWDDALGALRGSAFLGPYALDVYDTTSQEDAAVIVLLERNGQQRVELIAHLDRADEMGGHFELNQCYAVDPSGAAPGCLYVGAFTLVR